MERSRAAQVFGSGWFWGAFVLLGYGLWTSAMLRYQEPHAPSPIGDVPAFRLVDQEGAPFGSSELSASLWIGAFIDDPQSDAAQAADRAMLELMRRLVRVKAGVYLITAGATDDRRPMPMSRGRWRVLHGDEAQLAPLRASLGADPRTLMLVDGAGKIRGRYGTDPAGLTALLRDFTLIISLEPGPIAQAPTTKP